MWRPETDNQFSPKFPQKSAIVRDPQKKGLAKPAEITYLDDKMAEP